jgi:hypothetical protein
MPGTGPATLWPMSELAQLDNLQEAAAERVSTAYWLGFDAAAEASYKAGFDAGLAQGTSEGARAALDTTDLAEEFDPYSYPDEDGCGDPDCDYCYPEEYDTSFSFDLDDTPDDLAAWINTELNAWAPYVDATLGEVERWAPEVDANLEEIFDSLETVDATLRIATDTSQLLLEIIQADQGRIRELQTDIQTLEAQADADALYLEVTGQKVDLLIARIAVLEDLQGIKVTTEAQ